MKVLFVIHDLGFADHLAVAYLSAIAKQLKHSTYFCSLDRDDLYLKVREIKPDVVAYSVNVIGFSKTVEANKRAKEVHDFVSIMGGPHPTFSPETFSESGMDAYCIGEGEYAFRDFLNKVEKGEPFDEVENLVTSKRTNPVRPLISNLDELPLPDRDLIISNSFLKDAAKKTFYVSRGCPFKCAYCCNDYYHELYKGKGAPVRRFSVERIIQEIEDVASKYRTDFIKFGDDCFAIKADDWLKEFAEKYTSRVGIPFNCYLRIDMVDDNLLALLKEAGCFSVHLSVDSVSHHVREDVLKRNMKNEDVLAKLNQIRSYGINTWVNFMLAVPDSTLQDDLETIKLSHDAKITYTSYTTTVPMEKTSLYDYCVENGLVNPEDYIGDMSNIVEKSVLAGFSEREKRIRYNILLLGALIAKLPSFLQGPAVFLIKYIPPNKLFVKVYEYFLHYYETNKIFKLPKDKQIAPRRWKRSKART